jgi:hypothetical protein
MDLGSFLVLDNDKNIDVEGSVTKFRNAVTVAAAKRKNDSEVVSGAVHTLFDRFPGAFIQIDAIKSMVCTDLKVHHTAYGEIGDRIHKFVQENTEAGNGITNEGKPALFVLRKGKGGGFARKADLKAAPTA